MAGRFTRDSRAVLAAAATEAGRRGDRRIGTEHLLLGLLHGPDLLPIRALGINLGSARRALDELDRIALAEIMVRISGIRFDPLPATRRRLPWTYGAQAVVKRASDLSDCSVQLTPKHLLLAILAVERPDLTSSLLDHLQIDRALVRARLAISD
jgi:ATP-dependent Clp protease ATP-binding subunit ClpA